MPIISLAVGLAKQGGGFSLALGRIGKEKHPTGRYLEEFLRLCQYYSTGNQIAIHHYARPARAQCACEELLEPQAN